MNFIISENFIENWGSESSRNIAQIKELESVIKTRRLTIILPFLIKEKKKNYVIYSSCTTLDTLPVILLKPTRV